ncbi:MAG TPA: hypothetical protein VJ732_06820, partial [Bryobacteraceae bacterium]|nr:hypothetical protein [Bryobacteraceae bacterium]
MRGRLLVALACLALGGCMVGPKYSKPAVPAAPAYQEQPPANFTEVKGWTQAKPGDASLRAAWWELFQIPELNRLEQEVDPSNQTLKASEARFRQARALIQVNRSQLYPTVSTGPTVTGNQLSTNRALGAPQGAPYSDLSLPVDFP